MRDVKGHGWAFDGTQRRSSGPAKMDDEVPG